MSEREDAKKHIRTMIMTALANSHEEAQADSTRTWQVITDAILDQITLPQSGWALKELSKPAPYQDAAPKRNSNARRESPGIESEPPSTGVGLPSGS
jgi:hypothetical protein